MKSNQFEILQIRELPSSIVRDGEVKKEEIEKSHLSYLIVFQCQHGNEAVALHVSLRYQTQDETVLLQEGVTIIARIEDWDNMSKDEQLLKKNERIVALVDYGLAFVGGMIYRHVSGTLLNSVIPPHISAADIMDNVVVEVKERQQDTEVKE